MSRMKTIPIQAVGVTEKDCFGLHQLNKLPQVMLSSC